MSDKLLECVPNFSEGRNKETLNEIARVIELIEGVKLLNMDIGVDANRTVFTFIGEPEAVIEAAFLSIKKAKELIDMRKHVGKHPRIGATDVMPLIPVKGMTMQEVKEYAHKLSKRVGDELQIPVYCYENSAFSDHKRNLASCRAGEYEGIEQKLQDKKWVPDFGATHYNSSVAKSGITVIGARDFLLAVNFNLNTISVSCASSIALKIREKGYIERVDGQKVLDSKGNVVIIPGLLKGVKAIGWYIKEYGIAQVSTNITDINSTPLHCVYEVVSKCAKEMGVSVTGTEIIGLLPKRVMIEAGLFYLAKQGKSLDVKEEEIISVAIASMGLSDLSEFNPQEKILETV